MSSFWCEVLAFSCFLHLIVPSYSKLYVRLNVLKHMKNSLWITASRVRIGLAVLFAFSTLRSLTTTRKKLVFIHESFWNQRWPPSKRLFSSPLFPFITREIAVQMRQIIYINKSLYKMKMIDSPLCTSCKISDESLTHFFCRCDFIVAFWTAVVLWLKSLHIAIDSLNDCDLIFGLMQKMSHWLLPVQNLTSVSVWGISHVSSWVQEFDLNTMTHWL